MNLRFLILYLSLCIFLGVASAEIQSTSTGAAAECNDGMYSTSTGSGTCSWHGGVRRWLVVSHDYTLVDTLSAPSSSLTGTADIIHQLRWLCIGVVMGSTTFGAVSALVLFAAYAGLRKVPRLDRLRTRLMWLLFFALSLSGIVLLHTLLSSLGLA